MNGISNNGRKIYDNILQTIGNTPTVRLNKVPKDHGLECEFFVKCEFFNPGGSIKDRISAAMMQDAEEKGIAKPGSLFVEPTSGNTGIGLSLSTAVAGYDCTIVTPDKNSDEKMNTMNLLGATVVQAPAMAPWDSPESYMSVTKKILQENPHAICCNQYKNEVNPEIHYKYTADEIIESVGQMDMIVMGSGTGGTVTGVGKKIKEKYPKCVVVVVDPKGSVIFDNGTPNLYFVEGIGGDFVPDVLDKTVIDRVEHPNDYDSFNMAREIIRKEGILCGGSSGAAMTSAIRAAKALKLGAGKKVVVILPDGIRNYMTKFVCDQWMEAHLFKDPPERDFLWWNRSISNLKINCSVPQIPESSTVADALAAMGYENDVALVINNEGLFKGVITKNSLRTTATNPKNQSRIFNVNESVTKHYIKTYYKIVENRGKPTIGLASRILDIANFVIVTEAYYDGNNIKGYIPKGIVTAELVLDYILKHQENV